MNVKAFFEINIFKIRICEFSLTNVFEDFFLTGIKFFKTTGDPACSRDPQFSNHNCGKLREPS